MSKEVENITETVMGKIRDGKVRMRPRVYFISGSIFAFIGLVASMLSSGFLIGLMRFSLRSHGPMGEYRLDQLLSAFPWWTLVIAIVGLFAGIWLLRRYDFSYKINFGWMLAGIVIAIITAGLIIDMTGFNDTLLHKGPMQGVMRQYFQESNRGYQGIIPFRQ